MFLRSYLQREVYGSSPRLNKQLSPPANTGSQLKRSIHSSIINDIKSQIRFQLRDEYGTVIPYAIKFSPVSASVHKNICAVTDEEGVVRLLHTSSQKQPSPRQNASWIAHGLNSKIDESLRCKNNVDNTIIYDCDWSPDGRMLYTASSDKSIRMWDVNSQTCVSSFIGHSLSVKAVKTFNNNPSLFVSGSRDGHCMIFDTRVPIKKNLNLGKYKENGTPPVAVIYNAHHAHRTVDSDFPLIPVDENKTPLGHTVTSVLVSLDDSIIVSSGSNDGLVKFWDLRTVTTASPATHSASLVKTIKHPNLRINQRLPGIASLSLDYTGTKLLVNYIKSKIHVFDWQSYTEKIDTVSYSTYAYKSAASSQGSYQCNNFFTKSCFSPDGNFILSGSSSDCAIMWKVSKNGIHNASPVKLLCGHLNAVTSCAWDPTDFTSLATISDDCTVGIWNLASDSRSSKLAKTKSNAKGTSIYNLGEKPRRQLRFQFEQARKQKESLLGSSSSAANKENNAVVSSSTKKRKRQTMLSDNSLFFQSNKQVKALKDSVVK